MSENNKFQIVITLENGILGVAAPIDNNVIILGMLELAKAVILSNKPVTQTEKKVLELVDPAITQ